MNSDAYVTTVGAGSAMPIRMRAAPRIRTLSRLTDPSSPARTRYAMKDNTLDPVIWEVFVRAAPVLEALRFTRERGLV